MNQAQLDRAVARAKFASLRARDTRTAAQLVPASSAPGHRRLWRSAASGPRMLRHAVEYIHVYINPDRISDNDIDPTDTEDSS